jgi:hypothetical protein
MSSVGCDNDIKIKNYDAARYFSLLAGRGKELRNFRLLSVDAGQTLSNPLLGNFAICLTKFWKSSQMLHNIDTFKSGDCYS